MAVEDQTIKRLLKHLDETLDIIEQMDLSRRKLLKDRDTQDLLDRRLHVAIEDCMDIASHIAAALKLPGRDTPTDTVLLLGEHGVIPKNLNKRIKPVIRFRNILAHEYRHIDYSLVFKNHKEYLKNLRGFAKAVVTFLEKNPHLGE